jgi:hypothetical protein
VWKKAQQEVRQHWFISGYIAAYIQVLYRVARVRRTGLTVTRGVDSSPQQNCLSATRLQHPISRIIQFAKCHHLLRYKLDNLRHVNIGNQQQTTTVWRVPPLSPPPRPRKDDGVETWLLPLSPVKKEPVNSC